MSLLLITKRGTQKKLVDEEINYNWAGNEFKNFQEGTKTKILFKRKKTIIGPWCLNIHDTPIKAPPKI